MCGTASRWGRALNAWGDREGWPNSAQQVVQGDAFSGGCRALAEVRGNMPIVSFRDLRAEADAGNYAVGYFEAWNPEPYS